MKLFIPLLALALLLLGGFFMGSSVTGEVTSQTCCFGENCPSEYLCSIAHPAKDAVPSNIDARLGVLMIFASVTLFIAHELYEKS